MRLVSSPLLLGLMRPSGAGGPRLRVVGGRRVPFVGGGGPSLLGGLLVPMVLASGLPLSMTHGILANQTDLHARHLT